MEWKELKETDNMESESTDIADIGYALPTPNQTTNTQFFGKVHRQRQSSSSSFIKSYLVTRFNLVPSWESCWVLICWNCSLKYTYIHLPGWLWDSTGWWFLTYPSIMIHDHLIASHIIIMIMCSSGERFASHDDIFDCRGSKRSGRLYLCSGPYLILPTIEWQIQHLCQHDFIFRFRISR